MKNSVYLILFFIIGLSSCDKNPDQGVDFDRTALLSNWSDHVIIPRYQELANKNTLQFDAINNFNADPNSTNLAALRSSFLATYLAWQACSSFDFGPAGMLTLRSIMNTYPVDTVKIKMNISNGNYNLSSTSNTDAIGLPALDYLLYGVADNEVEILSYYSNNANARDYLLALSTQMNDAVSSANAEWNMSYSSTFKSANGTDIGSSLGLVVNEMNLDFESYIRDGKIGIPLGKRSLGTKQLDKAEAYYSAYSLELVKESVLQLQNLFNGTSNQNVNGIGLDDYLDAVKATHSGMDLSDKINLQFEEILTALNQLNGPIPNEIQNNEAKVEEAYNKMQQLIVLLKVDLPSNLGVQISYQDNDGD